MEINIKYFGMAAEAVKTESEKIDLADGINTAEFKIILEKKYPSLSNINYNVALNFDVAGDEDVITEKCEIAILPPYAGG